MAPYSMSLVLPSPTNPPTAIQKGTRSSRNPHPIYTILSYHCLSSPYFAFISTLSFVSIPHTVHEVLSHPGWKQAMVEEMASLHSTGAWDLAPYLLTSLLLVVVEFILLRLVWMVGEIVLRLGWLARGILRYMGPITMTLSLLLPR